MTAPHSRDVPLNRLPVTRDRGLERGDIIIPSNPFGGKSIYLSPVENGFFVADRRWIVVAHVEDRETGETLRTLNASEVAVFFDGSYESRYMIEAGERLVLNIQFPNGGYYPGGYAYGDMILNFYSDGIALPENISLQVYCTHQGQGVGWKDLSSRAREVGTGSGNHSVLAWYNGWFGINEITLTVDNDGLGKARDWVSITQFEFYNTRPTASGTERPFVTKYVDEYLYKRLTWKNADRETTSFIDEDGTAQFKRLLLDSGTTEQRPTEGLVSGMQFFDKTIGRPIWWDGSKWINASGGTV